MFESVGLQYTRTNLIVNYDNLICSPFTLLGNSCIVFCYCSGDFSQTHSAIAVAYTVQHITGWCILLLRIYCILNVF